MPKSYSISIIKTKKDLKKAFEIRRKVFVEEQKINPDVEYDEYEPFCKHFLIKYKNKPVGVCRVRFIENKAKMERLAILKKYRGLGLGKLGIMHMTYYSKRLKKKKIYMHAQYYLKNYYLKLGFLTEGKPFMEEGIKHIKMYYPFKGGK